MKNFKKFGVAMLAMAAVATTANAQDEVETTVSADVVSSYIWRGQDCGNAAIQPTLGISYKGLSLTAWGSYGIVDSNDAKEFDITLGYSVGGFNIGVTDYWFNTGDGRYFEYSSEVVPYLTPEGDVDYRRKTAHVFEANVGYDFGPLAIQWYTNFAGNDGANKDGDRAYSSYVELSAPFKLGGCDWSAAVGAVPYATTSYADVNGFAVTNVSLKATKDIKITDTFSIPVFGQVAANPATQKAYLVFGVTLKP